MRFKCFLVVLSLVGATAVWAQENEGEGEQDYVASHPEFYKVLVDNERVRVLEYTLEPGEKEGWHTHPDIVLYVVEGGTIRADLEEGGPMDFQEVVGEAKYLEAGPKHTAHNIGDKRIRLLITEFK